MSLDTEIKDARLYIHFRKCFVFCQQIATGAFYKINGRILAIYKFFYQQKAYSFISS